MDSLPFAKRPARTRPMPPASPHQTFDQVIYHTPINKQSISDRNYQEGSLRQVEMKTPVRTIDGRSSQAARNRENMFSVEGIPCVELTRTKSPALNRSTRHGFTPYNYSTYWMTHPTTGTSLSPVKNETYKTSFLSTDIAIQDKEARAKIRQSRCDSRKFNEDRQMEYNNSCDQDIKKRYDRNILDVRMQREAYKQALDDRHKIEKIRFFE